MAGRSAAGRHSERGPGRTPKAPQAPVALGRPVTQAAAGASVAAGARGAQQPYPELAAPPGGGAAMTGADRALQAWLARFTGGLSPVSLGLAWFDWAAHLAMMPGRQAELAAHAWRKATALPGYALPGAGSAAAPHEPRPQDPRFTAPGWQRRERSRCCAPYELIWSRAVREYLLGEWQLPNGLMAWNADGTRLPYRMHSEYLHGLFLRNGLFEGRYLAGGRPVTLSDIRVPVFMVATVRDHVAPWRSVYKLNLVAETELTFLLTSGGHNAGIVSEPGHPHRSFQVATRPAGAPYTAPEIWVAAAPMHEGSWWPAWEGWLADRSGGRGAPPPMGAPGHGYPVLADAPGSYVHER